MGVTQLLQTVISRFRSRKITPRTPPVQFIDECGREVDFRPYRPTDFEPLFEMYEQYDPTQRAQGVPPLESSDIEVWLSDIVCDTNIVAESNGRIVGHVSFVPDGTGRHELAIFVHQEYQRAGIGSMLMETGLGQARREAVTYVWLSVEKSSSGLLRFYTRAGFTVVNPMGVTYRMSRYL